MSTVSTSTTTTPVMSPTVMPIVPLPSRAGRGHRQQLAPTKRRSPIDPFLLQYLKVGTSTGLNLQELYFSSLNDNYKNKSIKPDIYQKYVRQEIKAPNEVKIPAKSTKPAASRLQVAVDDSPDQVLREFQKSPILNYNKNPIASLESIKISDPEVFTEKLVKKLPENYMQCNINDLIVLIARMLANLISINDKLVPESISHPSKLKSANDSLTRYHSRTPPKISTYSYLSRLTKFNNFNGATLLTTIYYIDLLSYNYQPFFNLNSWTVHRFLLVATMLSQKLMEDFFYTNDHYAKVGGVALNELNCLELDFLTRVDWKVVPAKSVNGVTSIRFAEDVLKLYYNQLIQLMGKNADKDGIIYVMDSETAAHDDDDIDEDSEDDLDDDDYDDEDLNPMVYSPEVEKHQYNSHGFSTDGSSSPHLKRRYSSHFDD